MRVAPRAWIGLTIWVGYVIVITLLQKLFMASYPEGAVSASIVLRGTAAPIATGSVLLAITTWALGWWRPALFEYRRSIHMWPAIAPVLFAVAALWNLTNTDFAEMSPGNLCTLIALAIVVGFAEELTTRGLLLTGLRGQLSEVWVWLISSAAFGAMHLANTLSGQAIDRTLTQAALTFCAGTSFYILRRVTGSLLPAMALHGLWDFSTFAIAHAPGGGASGAMLSHVSYLLALLSVAWVVAGANEGEHLRSSDWRPSHPGQSS